MRRDVFSIFILVKHSFSIWCHSMKCKWTKFFCRRDGKISKKRKCNVILGTKFYFECKLSLCYVTCLRFLPVNVRKWKSNSMKCVPVCMFVCISICVVYHKYLPPRKLDGNNKTMVYVVAIIGVSQYHEKFCIPSL